MSTGTRDTLGLIGNVVQYNHDSIYDCAVSTLDQWIMRGYEIIIKEEFS